MVRVVRAPYHQTLYEFLQLLEEERIAGILERYRMANEASLTSLAVNDPQKLRDVFDAIDDDAGARPTREVALAKGMELAEMIRQIDERRERELAEQQTAEAQ